MSDAFNEKQSMQPPKQPAQTPPTIDSLEWGKLSVDGTMYKDAVITPDGALKWDWTLDGTKHNPGISVAAIKAASSGVDHIILTSGMCGKLQVHPDVAAFLHEADIDFTVCRSDVVPELYAHLAKSVRVAVLLHSTC